MADNTFDAIVAQIDAQMTEAEANGDFATLGRLLATKNTLLGKSVAPAGSLNVSTVPTVAPDIEVKDQTDKLDRWGDLRDDLEGDEWDEEEEWDEDAEDDEPFVPEGFADRAEYDEFLLSQGESVQDGAAPHGTWIKPNGEVVELGNLDENIERVRNEATTDYDENGEEIEDEGTEFANFIISYTNLDGNEMTTEHVSRIINDPASRPLFRQLDKNSRLAVLEGKDETERLLAITFTEEDESFARAIERGLLSYRGELPIRGVGMVRAATLSTAERDDRGL